MLTRLTNHQFYEVWSEDACESVFVDKKPTYKEVTALWKENWPGTRFRPVIYKLNPFYTNDDEVTTVKK